MSAADEPLVLDLTVFARRVRTRTGPALHDIDLDIIPGEIFAITGRTGSGKTTLLEGLVGLHPIEADALVVCGSDPRAFPATVRERIGVAPVRATVDRALRVDEALALFGSLYDRPTDPDELIEALGLSDYRHTACDRLPPDASQCCSLALALLNDPVALFVDEPTRDLDPEQARRVWTLLRDRRRRGRTVVMTTDRLEEAERLADRVAVLRQGRLVVVASPRALLARTERRVLVTFELTDPAVDLPVLRALDAAVDAARDGDVYAIWTTDGFATVRSLIKVLDALEVRPRSLHLRPPGLEDVFIELTSEAA